MNKPYPEMPKDNPADRRANRGDLILLGKITGMIISMLILGTVFFIIGSVAGIEETVGKMACFGMGVFFVAAVSGPLVTRD